MVGRRSIMRKLSAAEFLDALERRLGELEPGQLRAALMAHAEHLPSFERRAFLTIFEVKSRDASPDGGKRAGRAAKAETLLRDIDALVAPYAQGRAVLVMKERWEDDLENNAWMDDDSRRSSAPSAQIDALLKRTDAVFRSGDLPLAREAYRRLLDAVATLQEEGIDEYESEEPELQSDLDEVKARYYRSLYETTPLKERPAALLKAMEELQYLGTESTGLPELIGARRTPLQDRDSFLEAWIGLLGKAKADPYGFGREIRRLLFQAVALYRGTDGLAELARRDGLRMPEAYRKWILALAEEDRIADSIAAARETLLALPPTGEVRAWVAEFLAGDAERRRDAPALLEARREAFRAAPDLARLSVLCEAVFSAEELERIAGAEATRLQLLLKDHRKRWAPDEEGAGPPEGRRLLAFLHLLSGDSEQAIPLAEKAPAIGWSGPDHPAPVVIPYLLVAAIGGKELAPETALADLWQEIDTSSFPFTGWDLDLEDDTVEAEEGIGWPADQSKSRPVHLTPFLRKHIEQHPLDPGRRESFLKAARRLAEKRVAAILKGKHRRAYERAARLVAAIAEARILAGDPPQGHAFLDDTRDKYSRFHAFTGELDKIVRRSPLLPSPPPKSRRW